MAFTTPHFTWSGVDTILMKTPFTLALLGNMVASSTGVKFTSTTNGNVIQVQRLKSGTIR